MALQDRNGVTRPEEYRDVVIPKETIYENKIHDLNSTVALQA
jgi:hypothetical protein